MFAVGPILDTIEKSHLKINTLGSVMKIKANIGLTWDQFWEIIKEDKQFLEKVKDSRNTTFNEI